MAGWPSRRFTRTQLEERRLAAVDWLERGTHQNQAIAEPFGVPVHTVSSWKARLKARGSLQATVAQGPQPRLIPEQLDQRRTLLQPGALAQRFPDDTWTTRRVRDLIGRTYGVWYHSDHVRQSAAPVGLHPTEARWSRC